LVGASPIIVVVVEVTLIVIIKEAVVIVTRNQLQRADSAVATKIPFSFHGKYRRPEVLARLPLEMRAIAICDEFIPFDREIDPVDSAAAHTGEDIPVGPICYLHPPFLKVIRSA
jgi:hypothetical protein